MAIASCRGADNRTWGRWCAVTTLLVFSSAGCLDTDTPGVGPDLLWGRRGIAPGRLMKPRALAIDAEDHLYLVDMTGRIQVFDADGNFLRGWRTPESRNGCPTGLHISGKGDLLVADTHYYRVLVYNLDGKPADSPILGGTMGSGPGEFGFITDVIDDSEGNLYVAEYGQSDRIQKFSADGAFILQWGSHGSEPGQFRRPQNLAIDDQNRIWVADACNHRIQIFDTDGHLLCLWGEQGNGPGQLYYPYGLAFDQRGNVLVCEYGNHHIQKFTDQGKPLGSWGSHGRQPGQMHNPWALARDSLGRIHILDSNNHRVQRILF
jgi:DNA-binding beta-propeller fold protein YncE